MPPSSAAAVPPLFRQSTHQQHGVTIVSVTGEIALASAPRLAAAMQAADTPTVVDLCGCTFIDSSGLAVLLSHNVRPGTELAIACLPGSPPAKLFDLTG